MCDDRGVQYLLKKYYRFCVFLLFIAISFNFLYPTSAIAANLESTIIRLQSITPNKASTPIYIQTTIPVGTTAVEDQVQLAVPASWSLSGIAGVSVSSLPSGVTAWPGISFGSTVGQTLIFSSSDLTPGTTYGFYITSGVSANPNSVEESQWHLSTYSGGSQVDTTTAGISILPNTGEVTITGAVQAPASAFTLSLDRTAPASTSITAGDIVSYEITYNHSLQYSSSMTFVASWSSSTPVLEYVVGSATPAYGGNPPVIDTVNNTITWTTTSMPSGLANQSVSFSLQAGTVVSESVIPVTIQAQVTQPTAGVAVSEQLSYQYQPASTPTPSPTTSSSPGSTPTSTPAPTGTPTPSAETTTPQVTDVRVIAVNGTSAQILVRLDRIGAIKLLYHSDSGKIESISGTGKQQYLFDLQNLLPNTTYYFWIADLQTGDRLTSETFSFTTTHVAVPSVELVTGGVIAYQGVWLQNWQLQENQVLVSQVPFDVDFTLSPFAPVLKSVWIELETAEGFLLRFPLNHTAIERLNTIIWFNKNQEFTRTSIHARTVDGLLITQQLGTTTVVSPVQIVSNTTDAPLPHALLEITVRNPQSNTFQTLSLPEIVRTSNENGIVPLLLAPGEYRITVSLPGFITKVVEITWPNSELHRISLEPLHGGLFGWLYQLPIVIKKTATALIERVVPLLQNQSIVQVAELVTGLIAAFVAILLIAIYGNIPLHILPLYFWQKIRSGTLFGKGLKNAQRIVIKDAKTNQLLSGALVTILDNDSQQKQLHSSRYGRILLSGTGAQELVVQKTGYKDVTTVIIQKDSETEIRLTPNDDLLNVKLHVAKRVVRILLGYAIEVTLGLIVLFELGLVFAVGWSAVPLFLISLTASIIWFYYHIVIHHHIEIE